MKNRALSNQSSEASHPASAAGGSVSPAEVSLPQVPNSTSKPSAKAAKTTKPATKVAKAVAQPEAVSPQSAANTKQLKAESQASTKATRPTALVPSGPFVVRRKQSLLSNPLAASGLIGVGGLALTLAVGLTLTDDSSDQPQFSFRENPEPDAGDVNAQLDDLGTSIVSGAVKPSLATPEFSSASRIKPTQIPQISVSRTLRGPQRALAIESMLDQQTQELDRLTRLLANGQPQAQPPAESALTQAMKTPTTADDAAPTAAAAVQPIPGVTAVDPQAAIASLPTAPVAGSSAQAPASAGIPIGEAGVPVVPRADVMARVDLSEIRKIAMAQTAGAEQPESEPMAIAVSGEFAPAADMEINPSMTLAQYDATVPAEMLEEIYSMQPSNQPSAVQPIMAVAPLTAEPAAEVGPPAPTVAEAPTAEAQRAEAQPTEAQPTQAQMAEATGDQGIRYFVSLEQGEDENRRVWMLPLTDQAATEVASADKVEAFRVFRLPEQEYQRVWLAVRSVNPTQDTAAPLYGFIDYQRQIIVMPVATAATAPATPAS